MVTRQVIKCEACGAALHPADNAHSVVCDYCGTRTAISPDPQAVRKEPELTGDKVYCRSCGKAIPADAVACCHCGRQTQTFQQQVDEEIKRREAEKKRQREEEERRREEKRRADRERQLQRQYAENVHRKWVAFTWCLLLGYFGAHKFYERKWGMGILYLFTGGLFGFGWLIDCVLLLFRRTQP